jgi:glucose/mannose-6-phosphate isomerase
MLWVGPFLGQFPETIFISSALSSRVMLDSAERRGELDSRGMLRMVADMPDHLSVGSRVGSSVDLERLPFKNVVICGLGGSAIGGDLVSAWLSGSSPTPVSVVRSYSLPASVAGQTLVIAVSYSGNTEETLSMVREAAERGARLVAVSSGGELRRVAEEDGIPHCLLPSGMVPRATVGYAFGTLTGVLEKAGIAETTGQLEETMALLTRISSDCGPEVPTGENPAKRLAHELHGTVPVIMGHGLSGPVARRWANQFNENAKMIAFSGELPEMNHNGIVGWVGDPLSQGYSMIFLDPGTDDPRMSRRVEATKTMLRERMRVYTSEALGSSSMARMFSQIMVGDFTSVYSAFLRGEDPSTTAPIEELKRMLSEKVE